MHLLRTETRSLDEAASARDLGQSPADVVFLSFSDADLARVSAAAEHAGTRRQSLRLANLAELKHPYSVDLYLEKVASKARFVLVRLLGGIDYWRYGVEELAAAARREGFALAVVPGDASEDPRLDEASTLPVPDLHHIRAAFQHGAPGAISALLDWVADRLDPSTPELATAAPRALPVAGLYEAACRRVEFYRGRSLVLFYRSLRLAEDVEPIVALADALAARGLDVAALFVTSLKDPEALSVVASEIRREKPDVILNTTGFSARRDDAGSVLDLADCPVLQVILSGSTKERWEADPRGLSAADLAMNVVLPEMDGRLVTRAISCKTPSAPVLDLEFTPMAHRSLPSRVAFVADLALAWVRLRDMPRGDRRIALVLSDYPAKGGRGGYAVGLDTPASVIAIAAMLREAGYSIGELPAADRLMRKLESDAATERLSLADYERSLADLPRAFVEKVTARWGRPGDDPLASSGGFSFRVVRAGNLLVALQPGRGTASGHKADYHDTGSPPCHAYVAFYLWLRQHAKIDAMIHCGTHGTLEWLPGKAVALDEACAPEALLGPLPVVYPFIVNNPGEAAQAKRRISALVIGHATPPLTKAGSHDAALEIEALFDEYAAAETLDPKRAKLLARAILDRAEETGLLRDSGLAEPADPETALRRLDAFLCDLKDMRIADGLHVFGRSPSGDLRERTAACIAPAEALERARALIDRCGPAEREALLAALDGRFVAPGPGGAPTRGRLDVMPTGRNLYGTDPRMVPTRTAYEIGRRAARALVTRHAQDRGDWPRRIILDLWASATMRTGGDDLAQALALLGVAPAWDAASSRVTGFDILPSARMDHPRIDVTLRISGLFRDIFPAQIALFDQAVQAVAGLDEDEDFNPLAAARRTGEPSARVFGGAPGTYGIGLARAIEDDAAVACETLAEIYLAAGSHAYGLAAAEGVATAAFRERVASADAFVHVQDQDGTDLLDSDALVEHIGGFSAAAKLLGISAAVYHVDTTRPDASTIRTLGQEIARVVRARAANPRWIAGMMRHGYRGAAEIAETVDHLFALAVLTDEVANHHFELLFDSTCATPSVQAFLIQSNPKAARAIAAKFRAAEARGFWKSRRNSTHEALAAMEGAPA